MSGVYAYCVLPGGLHPPSGLAGLEDRPVTGYEVDALTVWISEAPGRPPLDLEAVGRHNDVVEAALGEPVAPLRFGAWLPDLAALADRVRGSSSQLEAALRLVEGRVEFAMRVGSAGGPMPSPVSDAAPPGDRALPGDAPGAGGGRAYLRALSRRRAERSRRRNEQDELAERLREFMGDMAVEQRVHYLSAPELVSVAHLVERRNQAQYLERAAAFAREPLGDLVVHVTGPWPPYSFAGP